MHYIVSRPKPRSREISFEDVLLDLIDDIKLSEMTKAPSKKELTNTRVDCVKYLPDKLINYTRTKDYIERFEQFYAYYQHMDIFFDENCNYAKQLEIKSKYEQEYGRDIEMEKTVQEKTKEELESQGMVYNPYYNTFYLLKSSSKPGQKKYRQIDAPEPALKNALSQLKTLFEEFMCYNTYHTSAFAYIPGRCTHDLVKRLQKNRSRWILKLDFSNFFGSVTLDFTMQQLEQIYPFSTICATKRGKTALKNCLKLCFLDGHLPQGTPISPLLTNIIMIPIDYHISNILGNNASQITSFDKDNVCGTVESVEALNKIINPRNGDVYGTPDGDYLFTGKDWVKRMDYRLIYNRYADDMYIGSHRGFRYGPVIDEINKILDKFNAPMKLNTSKTKYCSTNGKNWILGLMYNQDQQITVGHRRKKELQATIANFAMDYNAGQPWNIQDTRIAMGNMSYVNNIEPLYVASILEKYSAKFGIDIKETMKSIIAGSVA